MSIPISSYVKVFTSDGILSIETDGFVSILHLYYRGKIDAKDLTPNECSIVNSNNQIIVFMNKRIEMPTQLLSYEGDLEIYNVKAANWDAEFIDVSIKKAKVDLISKIDGNFETLDNPNNYDQGITIGKKQDKTSIIKENLNTSGGEYYFEDGTEYKGKYHKHGSFQAMTGDKHSDRAVNIYLKDGNNRLFKPNDRKYKKAIKLGKRIKNG